MTGEAANLADIQDIFDGEMAEHWKKHVDWKVKDDCHRTSPVIGLDENSCESVPVADGFGWLSPTYRIPTKQKKTPA